MNRLSKEKSPYLRQASKQKIDWYPWSEEAFQRAKEEDKPVFLSSGAVWCHWCHVMAKECFYDDTVIELLNERFICIKLDRDERPDIDKRYQTAISAMGYGSGWPLTVFLTYDKKPFFGGTYYPLEDKWGIPGFKRVLITVSEFYKKQKNKILDFSEELLKALTPPQMVESEISEDVLDKALLEMSPLFDLKNGGFGSAPKFPMPGINQFLMNRYIFTKDNRLGNFIKKTLLKMARGGMYDQLLGGFHRYSTDASWIIPHFEKMADDNSWLLRNYIQGYEIFKEGFFKEVAEGIIRFFLDTLTDPDGGIYVSQDADVTPDDEGGYFTWSDEDFRRILTPDEYNVLKMHYFSEKGSMHHDTSKKVLSIAMDIGEIAMITKMDIQKIKELINSGKSKLLEVRKKRETPFIDKTLYTSTNCMAITSFIKAYRSLSYPVLKEFALKSLDRIISQNYVDNTLYRAENIKAILDDYIYLIEACISAYEVTGKEDYLNKAIHFMDLCIDKLWDKVSGGFFDTEDDILGIKLKLIEDTPYPSANAIAIELLLKLGFLSDNKSYLDMAEKSLKIFYRRAMDVNIHGGSYFNALDSFFNSLKLHIYSNIESPLTTEVLQTPYPHLYIAYREDKSQIIPCYKNTCYQPIKSPAELQIFIKQIMKD